MPVAEESASEFLTLSLRETNSRLRDCLDCLTADPASPHEAEPVVRPQELAVLLSELMRAGARLRSLPEKKDAALEFELGAYRTQVERLRDFLPAIQRSLLRQRARIEQERSRVQSAVEWARRSRQTL